MKFKFCKYEKMSVSFNPSDPFKRVAADRVDCVVEEVEMVEFEGEGVVEIGSAGEAGEEIEFEVDTDLNSKLKVGGAVIVFKRCAGMVMAEEGEIKEEVVRTGLFGMDNSNTLFHSFPVKYTVSDSGL